MKKWYAIFAMLKNNDPRELVDAPLERFDQVAEAGEMDGRKIVGMWIIDEEAEHLHDVTKIHGPLVPENIVRYYHNNLRRKVENTAGL